MYSCTWVFIFYKYKDVKMKKTVVITSVILAAFTLSGCTLPEQPKTRVIKHHITGKYYYVNLEECALNSVSSIDHETIGCFDNNRNFLYELKPMSDAEVNYYFQAQLQRQAQSSAESQALLNSVMNSNKHTSCTGIGPFMNCSTY